MQTRVSIPGAVAALAVSLSIPCLAQPAASGPTMSRVQLVHVKLDMLNDWTDLQKNEVVPALKKGGTRSRTVYQTNMGNGAEFLIVTPFNKFAEFDADGAQLKALGAAANGRLVEKLRKTTDNNSNWIITQLAALSTVNVNSLNAAKIVSVRLRLAPGKMDEFQNLFKAEMLPAYKKVKADVTVTVRSLGANPNDVTITSPIAKYADLDKGPPVVQALGPDGAAKLAQKFTGTGTIVEIVVRTRLADLSF